MEIEFDHILIVVKNLEKSIDFYKILGFDHLDTIQRPNDLLGIMRKNGIKLELMMLPEGKETYRTPRVNSDVGFRHFGFKVENILETYQRLKNKIEFVSPPQNVAGRPDRKILFFKDPNGVELHFIQE
jgi:catechol 2,3-dioxygenase-like lactoylglutathione lyase family enzyme